MYDSVEEVLIQIELGAREKLCARETYYRHPRLLYDDIFDVEREVMELDTGYYVFVSDYGPIFFDRNYKLIDGKKLEKYLFDYVYIDRRLYSGKPIKYFDYFPQQIKELHIYDINLKYFRQSDLFDGLRLKDMNVFSLHNTKNTRTDWIPSSCNYYSFENTGMKVLPLIKPHIDQLQIEHELNLGNLHGCPAILNSLLVAHSSITSLKGAPSKILKDPFIYDNPLLSGKQVQDYLAFLSCPSESLMDETQHYKPRETKQHV